MFLLYQSFLNMSTYRQMQFISYMYLKLVLFKGAVKKIARTATKKVAVGAVFFFTAPLLSPTEHPASRKQPRPSSTRPRKCKKRAHMYVVRGLHSDGVLVWVQVCCRLIYRCGDDFDHRQAFDLLNGLALRSFSSLHCQTVQGRCGASPLVAAQLDNDRSFWEVFVSFPSKRKSAGGAGPAPMVI